MVRKRVCSGQVIARRNRAIVASKSLTREVQGFHKYFLKESIKYLIPVLII